jgi:integrase/recombinase XerD
VSTVAASGLHALLAEHETWLTAERGLAANTVAAYRRDLRRYAAFLPAWGVVAARITEADIAAYAQTLRSGPTPAAPASVARALAAVRSFHRFCRVEELLADDPTAHLDATRVPAGLPKALDEHEVEMLLDAVVGETPAALRNRAVLETLYAAGLRISELVGLDLDDVDLDESDARVRGKGGKERIVPIGRAARDALEAYVVRGRPALLPAACAREHALFVNHRGGRLSRQGCWTVVRAAAVRAGLADRVTPHVLRHSCATHMLDHGADIRIVQELLGHASLSTTQVYTKVTVRRLQAAYDAAHPRARRRGADGTRTGPAVHSQA